MNKTEEKVVKKKKIWPIMVGVGAVVLIAVLATVFVFVLGKGGSRELKEQLDLGEKYLNELDYEQAIASYEMAIEIDPKSEDAYIGLATVYEAMEEYQKAYDILAGAYEKTDANAIKKAIEKYTDRLNEKGIDIITEEDAIVKSTMIDNVKHPAYYEYELTDEDKSYLDNIIRLLTTSEYGQAVAALDYEKSLAITNHSNKVSFNNSIQMINFVYANYKIFLKVREDAITMIICPLQNGTGYALQRGGGVQDSYLYGNCTEGYFNGEFFCHANYSNQMGEYSKEFTGTAVSGMLDGILTEYGTDYSCTIAYSMGHLQYNNLKDEGGSKISYCVGDRTNSDGTVKENIYIRTDTTINDVKEQLDSRLNTIEEPLAYFGYIMADDGTFNCLW